MRKTITWMVVVALCVLLLVPSAWARSKYYRSAHPHGGYHGNPPNWRTTSQTEFVVRKTLVVGHWFRLFIIKTTEIPVQDRSEKKSTQVSMMKGVRGWRR